MKLSTFSRPGPWLIVAIADLVVAGEFGHSPMLSVIFCMAAIGFLAGVVALASVPVADRHKKAEWEPTWESTKATWRRKTGRRS